MVASTRIELACDALPTGFRVVSARGREAVNSLSRWEILILSDDPAIALESVLRTPAAVRLVDELEGTTRTAGLLVSNMEHRGETRDGHHYAIGLAPAPWLLTLRSGYRIFQNKTTKDIVAQMLKDAGIPADQVVFRLAGNYVPRPSCTQYGETEWAFIERLLADEGISYWFALQGEDKPIVVFGDAVTSHDTLSGSSTIPYEDIGGSIRYRRFFELERHDIVTETAVHVRDFDVRAPAVLIEGKAGEGPLEYYAYPANVLTSAAASDRAKIRLEQLQRFASRTEAKSDCIRLEPGRVVTVDGCSDAWLNGEFLVVEAEHTIVLGQKTTGESRDYTNRVMLVPHGKRAFRPDLPRSVPKIEGVEPGHTTGPSGQEIHVDDLGRVKVRFPWDRSGIMDDTSSYWVRCLQMNLGGSMVLPRVGWEVPVVYFDGDPDRPFVLGRVYNATAVVPYGMPGAAATTTMQSATSPGGGSTNEIRMADGAGKQELFVHASKDQTVVVGGSASTDVSANETHNVALALSSSISGSHSTTVGASQSVNVGTDYAISVNGGRSELVGAMENIKVTANRFVTSGGYSELVGALYGIQCNQSNGSVKGAFTQLVGGLLATAGGLGMSETVIAARTELVGGVKSILAGSGASESVTGAKILIAGTTSEKAGGAVVTSSKGVGKITVAGTANLTAGGKFIIDAPSITITAASLDTKAFSLSGGAIKPKSGTTKVKASSIKRNGGGTLG